MKFTSLKIFGNWPRSVFSAWFLLFFLLIGYNSLKLMAMLNPPVAGQSVEVKLASYKWRRLQEKILHPREEIMPDFDLDMVLFKGPPETVHSNQKIAALSLKEKKLEGQGKIKLPYLSGILCNTNIEGKASSFAIINGKRFREKERVEGFIIQEVSDAGVLLSRGGRKWFLKAPNVRYSHVDASGPKNKDGNP